MSRTVEDPPETFDEEAPRPHPRSATLAALATTCLGAIGAEDALAKLSFLRAGAPSVHNYAEALRYAEWVSAQEHKRAVIALEVGRLLVSALLLVAGSRVLLRVREAGWLWRQALLGNVVWMAATALSERMFVGAWTRALVESMRHTQIRVPGSMQGASLEESARLAFAGFVFSTWLLDAIMLGFFVFAARARTRETTG